MDVEGQLIVVFIALSSAAHETIFYLQEKTR